MRYWEENNDFCYKLPTTRYGIVPISREEPNPIFKAQTKILSTAIKAYLKWRKDPGCQDHQKYASGLFTWLRHYNDFDETRAKNLDSKLNNRKPSRSFIDKEENPLEILKTHFQSTSKLNNHSLDTYLLDSIFANASLFLIDLNFDLEGTEASRMALRQLILLQEYSNYTAEYAYKIGESYEMVLNLDAAEIYYQMALKLDEAVRYSGIALYRATIKKAVDRIKLSKTNLASNLVLKERREVLISAVETYLSWRKHWDTIDTRYETGVFSRLRHYSDFGERRAKTLSRNLRSSNPRKELDPLVILKTHFKTDSKLNNHSLDTYLLEAIFQNACLFLLDTNFNLEGTEKSRQKLQELILKKPRRFLSEELHDIGKAFYQANNLDKAFLYYKAALEHDQNTQSEDAMTMLAVEDYKEAQSFLYSYYQKQNPQLSFEWGRRIGVDKSILESIPFVDYFLVGSEYEKSMHDIEEAIYYYKKAYNSGSTKAAYRLACYYHKELNLVAESRYREAFKYYHFCVIEDPDLLPAMEEIVELLCDDQLRLELVSVYFKLSNPSVALNILKMLAVKKTITDAYIQKTFLKGNSEYTLAFAKLYETDLKTEGYLEKAFMYYLLAYQYSKALCEDSLKNFLRNPDVKECLLEAGKIFYRGKDNICPDYKMAWFSFELAKENNFPEAFYYLGRLYHLGKGVNKKDLVQAVFYYQQASDLNINKADGRIQNIIALNSEDNFASTCGQIGALYEDNQQLSLQWKERASRLGNAACSLYLGEFFAQDHSDYPKDNKKAFIYHVLAYQDNKFPENKIYEDKLKDFIKQPGINKDLIEMGKAFYHGTDIVKQDHNLALFTFEFAQKENFPEAFYYAGRIYDVRKDANPNLLVQAICYYQRASDLGIQAASFRIRTILDSPFEHSFADTFEQIADMYQYEKGVKIDLKFALLWRQKASSLGNTTCSLFLAEFFEMDHVDCPRDNKKAFFYYVLAYQNNKSLENKTYENALKNFISTLDSKEDLIEFGKAFYKGRDDGIYKNHTMALFIFELAKQKNVPQAFYYLGHLYYDLSKEQNLNLLVQAVLFYQQACDLGLNKAAEKIQTILALPANIKFVNTFEQIATLYERGEGVQANPKLSILWKEKASKSGSVDCSFFLGQFFQVDHPDFPKNKEKAFCFYLQAAKLGSIDSLSPLERLAEAMSAKKQQTLSQVYASYFKNHERAAYWKNQAEEAQPLTYK